MVRATPMIRAAAALIAGLAVASAVSAGGGTVSDSGRRPTTSFNMIVSVTAPAAPRVAPSMGAGIAPKAVVSDPYRVPMIQNAGSLGSSR
jgi:hypothetical protein